MNFQRCECSPVCQLLYCTTVLFKVLYCKMKKCFFLMYYLCGKYYKPITVQYYIADCVNWVSRLTLTRSSVLAWRIGGTGGPARLPSLGSHRVGHNRRDSGSSSRLTLLDLKTNWSLNMLLERNLVVCKGLSVLLNFWRNHQKPSPKRKAKFKKRRGCFILKLLESLQY